MENKKIKYLIALAGLFHDIGKFYQRATGETASKESKEIFKHAHAALSAHWIEKNKDIFEKIENGLTQKLIFWGASHHKPNDNPESIIIQKADWYSSAHEREDILQDENDFLHSVFERITLKEKYSTYEQKYFGIHRIKPLSLERCNIFPKRLEGYIEKDSQKPNKYFIRLFEDIKEDHSCRDTLNKLKNYKNMAYSNLFKSFEEDFKKVNNHRNFEQKFNFLYYLLQKYTWSVPASYWSQEDKNNHYPDISLFDHSRVLSAIATSMYDYWQEKQIKLKKDTTKDFDNEEAFLLIEGDIGGIQKFLFNIYKTSEASEEEFSIAKALRGRSFILSVLPDVLARYILKQLGYPLTNALYIGGGKFQLLVGNTARNKEELIKIEEEINRWLKDEFEFDLSFVIATVSFKGKIFKENDGFLNQIEKLQIELDKKKKQKLGELIFEEIEPLEESTKELCVSCRTITVKDVRICKWCKKSHQIGNKIPKIRYLAFSSEEIIREEKNIISFGNFGSVFLFSEEDIKDKNLKLNLFNDILLLNSTEFNGNNTGFKFLGNTVPIITKENKEILKSLADEDIKDNIKPDNVLPFEVLVKFAEGDKKLGFFRADVDNLGLILSDGLRGFELKGIKEESRYTISRIATLSRMLDLFFSGYLNKLAEEETQRFIRERKDLKNLKINSLIYIVYSGGDDLFIIAPYDLALSFAYRIREEFRKYTCENREFGISGGFLIASHNLPIHLVAKYAEGLEDKAKEGTKDKIAIFSKSYKWSSWTGQSSLNECEVKNEEEHEIYFFSENEDKILSIESILQQWKDFYENDELSRGFIYNLLTLHKNYVKENREDRFMIYPKLHYQIARNIKDENVRNTFASQLLNIKKKEIIENLDTIVSLLLMKTRKGG